MDIDYLTIGQVSVSMKITLISNLQLIVILFLMNHST